MFTEAMVFGRIVGDLDLTPIDPEEWVQVVKLATAALFILEPEQLDPVAPAVI